MKYLSRGNTLLLRIAVAFAFLYPPFDALSNPNAWISYFPQFMRGYVPDMTLLYSWAVLEVIIAVWILSGKRIFLPSALATVLLCLIVAFNFSLMEIVFRDLSIALVALTLAIWSYNESPAIV